MVNGFESFKEWFAGYDRSHIPRWREGRNIAIGNNSYYLGAFRVLSFIRLL